MSASVYLANAFLDEAFGGVDWTPPATVYLALGTDLEPADDLFTECDAEDYGRLSIPNDKDNFETSVDGSVSNKIGWTFDEATTDWGTQRDWALYDAPTGGNQLVYGKLDVYKVVYSGDSPHFRAGLITINAD